jgi:hypothetical protein
MIADCMKDCDNCGNWDGTENKRCKICSMKLLREGKHVNWVFGPSQPEENYKRRYK